jgi:hypothetical protein
VRLDGARLGLVRAKAEATVRGERVADALLVGRGG